MELSRIDLDIIAYTKQQFMKGALKDEKVTNVFDLQTLGGVMDSIIKDIIDAFDNNGIYKSENCWDITDKDTLLDHLNCLISEKLERILKEELQ